MRSLAALAVGLQLVLASTGKAQPAAPQSTPTVPELRAVVRYIVGTRLAVLEDTTRIDFCAVDALWAPNGTFIARDEAGDLLLYANRSECPAPRPRAELSTARSVTVRAIEARGDSIRAESVTTKSRGLLRIFELYTMVGRREGSLCCGSYMVYGLTVEDPREHLRLSSLRRRN